MDSRIKARQSDEVRDTWLRSQDFRVLRFWNTKHQSSAERHTAGHSRRIESTRMNRTRISLFDTTLRDGQQTPWHLVLVGRQACRHGSPEPAWCRLHSRAATPAATPLTMRFLGEDRPSKAAFTPSA